MRNVSFSSNSLTNAALTDNATGSLLYELTTPYGFRQNTTLLDDQKNVVGVYMPNGRNDKATYQGRTTRVNDWLVKDVQTGSRTFMAPDGRTYRWDILSTMGMRWQLFDCQTGGIVAGALRQPCPPVKFINIDISRNGESFKDVIVLTFVICELTMRYEESLAAFAKSRSVHSR